MSDLFVDIETAPDMKAEEYFQSQQEIESGQLTARSDRDRFWKFKKGGLTPFNGKVILITYKANNGYVHRLKEWEDGEAAILEKFFGLITDLQKGSNEDWLRIIGHNILGFDLFFLYNRMKQHNIREERWLYHYMINKPELIDFLQMHLPLNNYNTKGLKHDVLAHAYGFATKETVGSEETLHYYQERYNEIIRYSEREFIYPELYAKIRSDGLVSAKELQESIRWYDSVHSEGNDN